MADTLKLPPKALPAIAARRDRAVSRLVGSEPAIQCPHVVAGIPAIICAEHPGAGLLCARCATAHTGRHPWAVEHRCDGCAKVAPSLRSLIGEHPVNVVTTTTAGRLGLYVGPVMVIALGVCPPCAESAGIVPLEVER